MELAEDPTAVVALPDESQLVVALQSGGVAVIDLPSTLATETPAVASIARTGRFGATVDIDVARDGSSGVVVDERHGELTKFKIAPGSDVRFGPATPVGFMPTGVVTSDSRRLAFVATQHTDTTGAFADFDPQIPPPRALYEAARARLDPGGLNIVDLTQASEPGYVVGQIRLGNAVRVATTHDDHVCWVTLRSERTRSSPLTSATRPGRLRWLASTSGPRR